MFLNINSACSTISRDKETQQDKQQSILNAVLGEDFDYEYLNTCSVNQREGKYYLSDNL